MDSYLLRHGIQASVELSLWLSSFSDIDLTYAGNYQIVPTVKVQSDIPSAVEVISLQSKGDHPNLIRSAYLRNNKYPCSQIFRLTRAAQTIDLDDLFTYRVFLLLNPTYLADVLNKAEITIYLEVFYISSTSTDTTAGDLQQSTDPISSSQPALSISSTASIRRELISTVPNTTNSSTSNGAAKTDNGRRRICLRTLKLRLNSGNGSLCAYRPVIFGSGCNLCSAEIGVFATLIALSEPYQRFHKTVVRKEGWRQKAVKDYVLVESTANFEAILSAGTTESVPSVTSDSATSNFNAANGNVIFTPRTLHTGVQLLKTLCFTLLASYEALQLNYFQLDAVVTDDQKLNERVFPVGNDSRNGDNKSSSTMLPKDCLAAFEQIEKEINETASEALRKPDASENHHHLSSNYMPARSGVIAECFEHLCEYGQMTVSRLSAETCQLWERHQQRFLGNFACARFLRKQFRQQQLSRLEEGVFLLDHPMANLLDASESSRILQRHDAVWNLIKTSPYYTMLPALPIECLECDGRAAEVPVVFADRYICVPSSTSTTQNVFHHAESVVVNSSPTTTTTNAMIKQKKQGFNFAQKINTLTQPGTAAALEQQVVGATSILVSEGAKAVAGVLNDRISRVKKMVANNIEKHKSNTASAQQQRRRASNGSTNSSSSSNDAVVEQSNATFVAQNNNNNGEQTPSSYSRFQPKTSPVNAEYMNQECSFWEMLREQPQPQQQLSPAHATTNVAQQVLGQRQQQQQQNFDLDNHATTTTSSSAGVSPSEQPPRTLAARTPATQRHIFERARADFRRLYVQQFNGLLWSDHPMRSHEALSAQLHLPTLRRNTTTTHTTTASAIDRRFSSSTSIFSPNSVHFIVCVHGLEGSGEDMKLVKTYLEQALPHSRMEFLICDSVEGEMTYESIDTLSREIVQEVVTALTQRPTLPDRISFIGHSMGTVLVRAAIAHEIFEPYRSRLYTFLSLSGPHLGLMSNPSRLVYAGLLLLQNWKRSKSLSQLAMKDNTDLRKTFLYQLSQKDKLAHFRNILLAASGQDFYAPYHSARIEMADAAGGVGFVANNAPRAASTVLGSEAATDMGVVSNAPAYIVNEMVQNIMRPIVEASERAASASASAGAVGTVGGGGGSAVNLIRYDVRCDQRGNRVDAITGRLNHIAFIDSEVFLEKFLAVHAYEYFM